MPNWHQRLYYMKTKNSSNKVVPLVMIDPDLWLTSNSKSNTLLSELTGHLVVRMRLEAPYVVILYGFQLNHLSPKIKWCINRYLKIPQVAHARLAQEGECFTWNQRLIRGSIVTGSNILSLTYFCFHVQNRTFQVDNPSQYSLSRSGIGCYLK